MNQKFVSGLGNIYTNEILFKSKLNPRLNINKISESKINALVKSTKVFTEIYNKRRIFD